MFRVENAGYNFEVGSAPGRTPRRTTCGIGEVGNQEMGKPISLYFQLFQRVVVHVSGVGIELEFTPTEFFGDIAGTKLNSIDKQGAEVGEIRKYPLECAIRTPDDRAGEIGGQHRAIGGHRNQITEFGLVPVDVGSESLRPVPPAILVLGSWGPDCFEVIAVGSSPTSSSGLPP